MSLIKTLQKEYLLLKKNIGAVYLEKNNIRVIDNSLDDVTLTKTKEPVHTMMFSPTKKDYQDLVMQAKKYNSDCIVLTNLLDSEKKLVAHFYELHDVHKPYDLMKVKL